MVKNTAGGNKAKGFARKNFAKGGASALRVSENESEVYVQVTKILGGPMCRVVDIHGKEMLCHIRGKFRGRNKRSNFIAPSTWLLVGLREWEKPDLQKNKLSNCDVIEIYSDADKDTLKNSVLDVNWNLFIANDTKLIGAALTEDSLQDNFDFMDEKTQEYKELIETQLGTSSAANDTAVEFAPEDYELINVDDI
jgi:hypothetical protein